MILKILRDDTTWVYLDKIRNISVDTSKDFALTILDSKDQKWLEVCGLSNNCDKDGRREINENHKFVIDNFILDGESILKQAVFNENNKRQFWGVKIISITYIDGNLVTIATLATNESIYLLNDEGKTVERL